MRWSHFIGVVWNADSGLWKALFKQADGEVKCLGSFANQKDAAVAYDTHAWRVEGAPGLRNHPPSHYTGQLPLPADFGLHAIARCADHTGDTGHAVAHGLHPLKQKLLPL